MKRSMFVLVIALATIIVGCENAPTGPTSSPTLSVDGLAKESYHLVRIPLSGTPREPYPNSGLGFEVSGFVEYSMVRVAGSENFFNLHLEAHARLTPRADDQSALNLASSSDYVVSVSEEGVTFQEIRYMFPERNDRLAMFITFQITTGNVEVADMALDFIE